MKNLKKLKGLAAACVCLVVAFTLVSCGNPYSGVDFDDYIEIGEYKGIELEKEDTEVTDEEVQTEIDNFLASKRTSENVKSGTVKDGDSINIDYVGSIDGETFAGGEEKGRDLVIGSNTFIPGFESSLIGARVGSTKNIKVKFPDTYGEKSLAGKNAVFAVTINSKKEYTTPELDEDFVKNNTDEKSVEDFTASVKKDLEKKKKEIADNTYRQKVWAKLIDSSSMKTDKDGNEKFPEKQLEDFIDQTMKTYEEKAKQENVSLKDYVLKNFQLDEEKFKSEIEIYGKTQVKMDMIMYYIAEKEGLKVTSEEYDEFIDDTLKTFGYTRESFEEANNGKSYETIVGKDKIKAEVLKKKVQDFLVSEAKFV